MKHKIVVLLKDGRRLKGTSDVFDPGKPFLLIQRIDIDGNTMGFLDVEMANVSAAFFVRDLALDRTSRQSTGGGAAIPTDVPDADNMTIVRVRFAWGEIIDGAVRDYDPDADWFYLYPVGVLNRSCNNERVYVTRDAIAAMETLEQPAV